MPVACGPLAAVHTVSATAIVADGAALLLASDALQSRTACQVSAAAAVTFFSVFVHSQLVAMTLTIAGVSKEGVCVCVSGNPTLPRLQNCVDSVGCISIPLLLVTENLPEIGDCLYAHFDGPDNWDVYPDVLPTLQHLKSSGVKVAVVSNFDERLSKFNKICGTLQKMQPRQQIQLLRLPAA